MRYLDCKLPGIEDYGSSLQEQVLVTHMFCHVVQLLSTSNKGQNSVCAGPQSVLTVLVREAVKCKCGKGPSSADCYPVYEEKKRYG